ncbi:MAG: serine/threonine-protein kinase [Acidimicrobiales bacterium]
MLRPSARTVVRASSWSTSPPERFADRVEADGRLDINAALQAGIEVAGALQTAHDHGVVHRDIKPSNLFVSAFGGAVLGDFGIASVDDERTVTGGGGLTVHYAPPELIEGEPASIASDIYSLAATLFTLVSGDKPFPRGPGQSTADLARRILLEPTPVLGDDAPPPLVSLLERAMAKRPDRRPSSAAAFGYELQQVQVDLGTGRRH